MSSGKANAMFISSSNMVLFWYTHEITTCALYIPEREAYKIHMKQTKDEDNISEVVWENIFEKHPMFKFWNLILKLELLLLEFAKSLRSGNF